MSETTKHDEAQEVSGSRHDRMVMCISTPGGHDYARFREFFEQSIREAVLLDQEHLGPQEVEPWMLRRYAIVPPEPSVTIDDKRPYWRRFEKFSRT